MRIKCPYNDQLLVGPECFNTFLKSWKCILLISFAWRSWIRMNCIFWSFDVFCNRKSQYLHFSLTAVQLLQSSRKTNNLKCHSFKCFNHALIFVSLKKAYFYVVSLYWYPHPMWLVPDWLSFAGVSVPAFLLDEANIVLANRKRAEADASCLRYARVLMGLARLSQFEGIKILRFYTFSPLKQLGGRSGNKSSCSQCRFRHKVIWKWKVAWRIMTKSHQNTLIHAFADLHKDETLQIGQTLKGAKAFSENKSNLNQSYKQCLPFSNRLWIL